MGKRRQARELAIQMLYQFDLGGSSLPQIFSSFDPSVLEAEASDGSEGDLGPEELDRRRGRTQQAFGYARALVEGTLAHLKEIDDLIRQQAANWRMERMPAVDRNILRLAVYEMLYESDIPKVVVVDEAIELAKKFGSEQSSRFINGLLDGLLKERQFPGSLT